MSAGVCRRCNSCCTYLYLYVGVDPDTVTWVGYHDLEVVFRFGAFYARVERPCRHLTEAGCAIYETRPQLCRDFECAKEPPLTLVG